MAQVTTNGTKNGSKTQAFEGQPRFDQKSYEIQGYGKTHFMPIGMDEQTRSTNVEMLNQLLADLITQYQLYKKHHWQVSGPTFYQLHLLLDAHAEIVLKQIDEVAERIQTLGGESTGMPFDVAEMTRIQRPPRGAESVPALLARTVQSHATIIEWVRKGIEQTDENKDYSTNDLLMSRILPDQEHMTWFVSQHLVVTPIEADGNAAK